MTHHDQRPIDEAAQESYSWLSKTYVFIAKTKVKTWKSVFAIAFITGIAVALIWSVSVDWHSSSSAASPAPKNECVAIPGGGEFSEKTSVKIVCGRNVIEAYYAWGDEEVQLISTSTTKYWFKTVYQAQENQTLRLFGQSSDKGRYEKRYQRYLGYLDKYNTKYIEIENKIALLIQQGASASKIARYQARLEKYQGKINKIQAEINRINGLVAELNSPFTVTYDFKSKDSGPGSLVATASAFNNGEAVANSSNIPLAAGKLSANNSDIVITELTFHGKDDNDIVNSLDSFDDKYFDKTNVSLITLLINGSPVSSKNGAVLINGEVTFNLASTSPILTIPAGDNAIYQVVMNVAGVLDVTNKNIHLQLSGLRGRDGSGIEVIGFNANGDVISAFNRVNYDRFVTLHDQGRLTISMDNNIEGVNEHKYIIAGTVGNKIARLKIKAEFEDIKINKIYIRNQDPNADVSVYGSAITDSEGNVLFSDTGALPGADNSIIVLSDDVNGLFTVPIGTSYYYITLDTRAIGDGVIETAKSGDFFRYYASGVEASGIGSNIDLMTGTGIMYDGETGEETSLSNTSTLVGTKIIDIVDQSNSLDLATGEQKVFQFKIDTAYSNNQSPLTGDNLKTEISAIKVLVDYLPSTVGTSSPFKLFREGMSGYVPYYFPMPGQEATFDLDDGYNTGWNSAHREITPGSSAVFYVTAQINSNDINDFIQCSIKNIDYGGIKWTDQSGPVRESLLLGISELVGKKLGDGSGAPVVKANYGELCEIQIGCDGDYVCKQTATEPGVNYCCKPSECASQNQGQIRDGDIMMHCAIEGGYDLDSTNNDFSICHNGRYYKSTFPSYRFEDIEGLGNYGFQDETGINDYDVVVGAELGGMGGLIYYGNGSSTNFSGYPELRNEVFTDINNNNLAVGYADKNNKKVGLIYENGNYSLLDSDALNLGTRDVKIIGVDNSGRMLVQVKENSYGDYYFYDRNNSGSSSLAKIDSTITLDDGSGEPHVVFTGMNNKGVLIGNYEWSGKVNGVVYRDGQYEIINFPIANRMYPNGINDNGKIVGTCEINGRNFGYMYDGEKYYLLNEDTDSNEQKYINDIGIQDVITGTYMKGSKRAAFIAYPQ